MALSRFTDNPELKNYGGIDQAIKGIIVSDIKLKTIEKNGKLVTQRWFKMELSEGIKSHKNYGERSVTAVVFGADSTELKKGMDLKLKANIIEKEGKTCVIAKSLTISKDVSVEIENSVIKDISLKKINPSTRHGKDKGMSM